MLYMSLKSMFATAIKKINGYSGIVYEVKQAFDKNHTFLLEGLKKVAAQRKEFKASVAILDDEGHIDGMSS